MTLVRYVRTDGQIIERKFSRARAAVVFAVEMKKERWVKCIGIFSPNQEA